MRALRYCLIAFLVSAPVVAGGCNKVFLFSREDEIALGRQYAPEFEEEFGGKVRDQRVQLYVQSIGRRLETVAERDMPYEFALLRSETPNAFALPGGPVYVTAGLFTEMTNERQLAAVLGHEIGHVVHRDSAKGLQRQVGIEVLAAVVGGALGGTEGEAAEMAAQVVGGLVNLKYSRDQEYASDQAGIKYMADIGYNPWGMIELLELLMREQEGGRLGEMLSTHPLTSKRIEEAAQTIRDEYPSYSRSAEDPNAAEFMRFRRIVEALPPPPPPEQDDDTPVNTAAGSHSHSRARTTTRVRIPDPE